jgi:two-component system chemotaxis response regulator CheY
VTDTANKRVLIIDDASLVRRYYRKALEQAGFAVEEAFNGLEGLEKVLASPFDLLIVDVNMPHMDGLTFLKTLRRREPSIASLPALVASTEAGPQDKLAARKAGANFYLVKPLSQETLVACANILCGAPA